MKLQDWRPEVLLEKRLQHRCFPVNIAKFLRTEFLQNTCSLCLSEILCDDSYRYITKSYFAIMKLGH